MLYFSTADRLRKELFVLFCWYEHALDIVGKSVCVSTLVTTVASYQDIAQASPANLVHYS